MEGVAAYSTYLALKRHFCSDSYDYFKYQGKVKGVESSFVKRKDRYFFVKLGRNMGNYLEGFLIANMVEDPNVWVGNLLTEESAQVYKHWQKKQESLSYHFINEISFLDQIKAKDFNELFSVRSHDHPEIIKRFLRKEISIESLIILNEILTFIQGYDKILNDPVYNGVSRLCKKYRPFMQVDITKCKSTMQDMVSG
jgi:hypothetical protein